MRQSKYDPVVDEVQLLEANPEYAHIRHADGRESTVALRHLAPVGEQPLSSPEAQEVPVTTLEEEDLQLLHEEAPSLPPASNSPSLRHQAIPDPETTLDRTDTPDTPTPVPSLPRCSTRPSRKPKWLIDYDMG